MSASGEAGHLVLYLHAHLPWVRHPEHDDFLEEDWLYEAITETYLPLLDVFDGWVKDAIPARITMTISPSLAEMFRDDLLMRRYSARLARLRDLVEREVERTRGGPEHDTACMYRARLARAARRFHKDYAGDLLGAFGRMMAAGVLEIATCPATHPFLPLYAVNPIHARGQIRTAVRSYRACFGVNPPGTWLPECGYFPGLDQMLADEGLCYFVVDTHGVALANPRPVFGTLAPIVCESGVLAFPRDPSSSKQVWSAEEGYPGDPRYREHYRDAGYDLPEDQLQGFLLPTGARRNVGLKYHRITGRNVQLHEKALYDRGEALKAVEAHAEHFVASRQQQIAEARDRMGRAPVVVAPYDAELFGHWWFEGPELIDRVVRKVAANDRGFRLSTPSDVIQMSDAFQVATPATTSWGDKGYGQVWCNEKNDWVWPHLHRAAAVMTDLATTRPEAQGDERRALNQMARELLLASASDWPFIMTMGTMVEYAERRVREHVNRFNWLLEGLTEGHLNLEWLAQIEARDSAFPELDYRDFAR